MKKKHMKKKQLAKLKEQFKPSWQDAQYLLFNAMKEQAASLYNLKIEVYIDTTSASDMIIELLDDTKRDQQIKVPLDDNFKVVIKRIQNNEKDLIDRFSKNLVEEIASYWIPEKTDSSQVKPVSEKTHPTKLDQSTEKSTAAVVDFIETMNGFPKFYVKESTEALEVFEKTSKEDRLLATVSMTKVNEFKIESALERKYKLKLDVIPVIEEFAALPIEKR